MRWLITVALLISLLAACAPANRPTPTATPSAVPTSTATEPSPSPNPHPWRSPTAYRPITLTPSHTPLPTNTFAPSPSPTVTLSLTPTFGPSSTPLATYTPTPIPPLKTSLKEIRRGRHIGTLIKLDSLNSDRNYRLRLLEQFDMVVINGFGYTYRGPGVFDFSATDPLVNFATDNGLLIRGQPIVYYLTTPRWITDGNWSRAEAREMLKEYVQGIVGQYRGRVAAWVVVNEAMGDDGELRPNVWLRTIGPNYINLAFRFAREADPEALLILNDYHLEQTGAKSRATLQLVTKMVADGVPIDGVGFQLHLELGTVPTLADLQNQMQGYADLGLLVDVTELDVRLKEPFTENRLGSQADAYETVMQACLNLPACKHFTMWGFTDRHSWIDWAFPGYGAAHIFDQDYYPKPAYVALLRTLQRFKPKN